jgi:hypothetical protein
MIACVRSSASSESWRAIGLNSLRNILIAEMVASSGSFVTAKDTLLMRSAMRGSNMCWTHFLKGADDANTQLAPSTRVTTGASTLMQVEASYASCRLSSRSFVVNGRVSRSAC